MTESKRRLAAILSADAVGYSRLMQDDEAATVQTIQEYRAAIDRVIGQHGGRIVNAPGDNILAEFPSAVEAVQAAVESQKSIEGRNVELPQHRRMQFRVGVNLGDVIVEDDGTIYGDGVNIAARMEALADSGGICVSNTIYEAVEGKIDFGFDFLGEQPVKNISRPVRVYRVRSEERDSDSPNLASSSEKPNRKIMIGAVAGVAAVLLALAVVGWRFWDAGGSGDQQSQVGRETERASEGASTTLDRRRIAVLPFTNINQDSEDDYFSTGITEELILQLSKVSQLRVIARTSVMKFRDSDADITTIGGALDVGTILEGSVRIAGDQVRVTAQLIDVADQSHVWSQNYDRSLDEIFEVQTDIANHVVEALRINLLSEQQAMINQKSTADPEAHRLQLQGRHFLELGTAEAMHQARERFLAALEIDPTYARAQSGLARYHYERVWILDASPADSMPAAKEAAQQALALDPTLAEAHALLAQINTEYFWDWDAAESGFKRALALNPSDAYARAVYGHLFLSPVRHQFDDALAQVEAATSLDPLSAIVRERAGFASMHAGDTDAAVMYFTEALSLAPTSFWPMIGLGRAHAQAGRHDEAIEWIEKAVEISDAAAFPLGFLCWAYGLSGQSENADPILATLLARADTEQVPAAALFIAYMGLGQMDDAYAWIETAYQERSNWMLWLGVRSFASILSTDPRYAVWMERMNLPMPRSELAE